MVVEVPSVRDAYRLASELRRTAPDLILDMRVERTDADHGRVFVPPRLAGRSQVREIVGRFGGRIRP